MGLGVVLVNLARDPRTVLTGAWITTGGAMLSVAAKLYELSGGLP
jgi:hypothetical protein